MAEGMRKAALFDFDGTLSSGYISMEFMDYLHGRGVYNDAAYREQRRIYGLQRSGAMTYDEWVERWGELWAEGLKGKGVAEVADCAKEFFKSFGHNIYRESRELVSLMAAAGFMSVVVSAGAYEVVSLAAADLGISQVYATRLEARDGVYTGSIETPMHLPDGKERMLSKLAGMFDYGGSYAFGDSVADASMLAMVGNPIALNPGAALREMAERRGWKVLYKNGVVSGIDAALRGRSRGRS